MNYSIFTIKASGVGESGVYCGTKYDLTSACQYCGTGAKLISPLRVKGIKKNKDLIETLDGDFIVSTKLYEFIKSEIPNITLNRVESTKREKLDFYHLYSENVLPPFKKESNGFAREAPCPQCNRNGYYNDLEKLSPENNYKTIVKPLNFIYSIQDFENFSSVDILMTWECVGASNLVESGKYVIGYARPWIVISGRVQDVLKKFGLRNLKFEPITIKK